MLGASEAGAPLMYVHGPMMWGISGFAEDHASSQLAPAFRTIMAAAGDNKFTRGSTSEGETGECHKKGKSRTQGVQRKE